MQLMTYIRANKEKYGIKQIAQPLFNHGSYSLYFLEPGTNGWEIECYESALRKESMARQSRRRLRAALDHALFVGAICRSRICSASFYPRNISMRRYGSVAKVLYGYPWAGNAPGQPKRLLYQASKYEVLRCLRKTAGFQTLLAQLSFHNHGRL